MDLMWSFVNTLAHMSWCPYPLIRLSSRYGVLAYTLSCSLKATLSTGGDTGIYAVAVPAAVTDWSSGLMMAHVDSLARTLPQSGPDSMESPEAVLTEKEVDLHINT